VGVACWLIARTPLTAALADRLQSWALAGAVILLFGVASFGWLYPDVMQPRYADRAAAGDIAWQPFSLEKLNELAVKEGRTVLVDFSAEWCVNCKVLEAAVLHTEAVEQAIAAAGAVTMYADYTDYPPEIERTIRALKSNGVPVIAIFPGARPHEPIVFRGSYTKRALIAALASAAARPSDSGARPMAEASATIPPLN
jgi:thiol:disulfide interchange protein